jgi:asparagine synthase (glutamine-hydrolysing)
MPGIFGLAGKPAANDGAALLAEMAARLRHHAWYQESSHLDEAAGVALARIALGFVNPHAQPACNADGSLLAMMDGEVYDYAVQRRRLAQDGHVFKDDSHAELLVHGFESAGKEFFRSVHGKFVAVLWDSKKRRLLLTNDRFGMRPLYYALLPGRLLFATEIKALLAEPAISRQSNLRGIAQFFTFGQLLGEDTLLEAVRLLPAAGWLTYDLETERLTLDRYYRLQGEQIAGTIPRAQMLDRMDQTFGDAVNRCTTGGGRLGLALSGGLDSRTILAAIDAERPLTTVSIGMDGARDHLSAAEMAQLTGRPHHQCLLGEGFLSRFEEHLGHMVRLTDGQYLSQCIVMPTLPVYRDLGIEVLLRGHAGELMHMHKAYNFSLDAQALTLRDETSLEDWLFRRLQTYMLDGTEGCLFAPAHRAEMEGLARESLRECLRESEGMTPSVHRIWHLFITQRLRRETAMSLVKFGSLVETRMPYLDNELVEALFATPPELKLDELIQAHILRRRMPAFLKVVNVNTGTRMEAGRLGRLLGKMRLKVLGKLGVRGYQPYERLGLWLRRELRPLVGRILLSDRCLARGIFDPQTLRSVVENHMSGRRNHTFLLMALMIFETGQREFIDRPSVRNRLESPDALRPSLCRG